MKPDVLIIGAGIAGLTAAARLGRRGLTGLVVEKSLFPGGRSGRLACKAAESCARCNACLLEEAMTEFKEAGGFELACLTEAVQVASENKGYEVKLKTTPQPIRADWCVACGLCLKECPARAVFKNPAPVLGGYFGIDPARCLQFQGQDCQVCREVCSAGAIDFSKSAREETVSPRAVLLTGGYDPFDARLKPRYGYGRLPDVVTALELEAMLRDKGEITRPSDGRTPDRVAFIQCVGSRDKSIGRDYCSRICCGYALRLAALIRHRRPETEASFFYMDIQNFGRDFDNYYRKLKSSIELIHGVPGEITSGEGGALSVPFIDESSGEKGRREFDLVVLSVGLGPAADGPETLFNLARNEDGFAVEPEAGPVFLAGAATGPLNVAEARADAEGAAARLAAYLQGNRIVSGAGS